MITRLLEWVRRRRGAVETELVTIEQRRYISPIFYAQATVVLPMLERHAHGKLIDLGCGTAPFLARADRACRGVSRDGPVAAERQDHLCGRYPDVGDGARCQL